MKYSGILFNDISAAPGLCVSFFTQGCPHRCPGCHNPETWDFDGGLEYTPEVTQSIIEGLTAQGIQRTLCIMGGEPLCDANVDLVHNLIVEVKQKVPDTKIYLWTGYVYEDIIKHPKPLKVLSWCDYVIDGPYIENLRDITLEMRGSSNQRIIALKS